MKRVLMILGVVTSSAAYAEVLIVPSEPSPRAAMTEDTEGQLEQAPAVDRSHLPARGLDMDSVRSRYGEPAGVSGPIGQPPITRWTYDNFVVFFEHRHVINAVIPGKPALIHHKDELERGAE